MSSQHSEDAASSVPSLLIEDQVVSMRERLAELHAEELLDKTKTNIPADVSELRKRSWHHLLSEKEYDFKRQRAEQELKLRREQAKLEAIDLDNQQKRLCNALDELRIERARLALLAGDYNSFSQMLQTIRAGTSG